MVITSCLAIAAVIGVGLTLYATRLGVDVSGDSVVYLEAARNVMAGRGLVLIAPDGSSTPLIVFPPLYPLVLAAGGAAGRLVRLSVDPTVVARYLNCAALIASLLFVALLMRRTTRLFWPIILALLLCVTSRPLMFGYTRLLSEAPFVVCCLAATYFLAWHLEARNRWLLVAASVAVACASLTRYAGVCLAFTGVCALALTPGTSLRTKSLDAVIFLFVLIAAMEAWALHNGAPTRPYGGRTLSLHPPPVGKLVEGARALGEWIGAREVPATPWLGFGLALALVCTPLFHRTAITLVCSLFVVSYVGFVLVSLTFFDAAIPLNSRIWMPLVPPLAILFAALLALFPPGRLERLSVFIPVVLLLLLNSWLTLKFARSLHDNGQGYLSRLWRNSALVATVNKLPKNTPIASNAQDALYVLTGRRAYGLPMSRFRTIAQDNPHLRQDLVDLSKKLRRRGVIAYSTKIKRGDFLPSENRIAKFLELEKIADVSDGRVYRVKGARKGGTGAATAPLEQP